MKNGSEYIWRLDALQSEVWINGKRVTGEISKHPSFKGVVSTQAALYDFQCQENNKDVMTFVPSGTGERAGTSFLRPKTAADLVKRRSAVQEWANIHQGFMGRSPDYMNTVLMVMDAASDLFAEANPRFGGNVRNYYMHCMKNDITLTHAFLRPQVDRSSLFMQSEENGNIARVIGKSSEGIIVSGAFMIATQGGMTDEILIFPMPCPETEEEDNPFAFAFAIPSNTKGAKFICREAYDKGEENSDYPLTSRFDEPDALVVMDDVLVPWERVFLDGDQGIAGRFFPESNFFTHVGHQIVTRQVVKTEFYLGVAQLLADTLNINEYMHVQDKLSELIVSLETMKALLTASEAQAEPDKWGTMMPDPAPISAAVTYYPRVFSRFAEIVQLIGASGLILIPVRKDFESPIQSDLNRYLATSNSTALTRTKYFRLAWDMSMSPFGTRQSLYERFFFGDPAKAGGRLCWAYDTSSCVDRVVYFLERLQEHKDHK